MGLESVLKSVVENLEPSVVEKLKELSVVEKLKELSVVEKLKEPSLVEKLKELSVVEKLKELWPAMENFWGQFLDWFDKIFPPETRGEKLHHWLQIALPFVIAGVVLTILLCCCKGLCCCYKCCCNGLYWFYKCCCKGLFCCYKCCSKGRRGFKIKMMKAPGRNFRMPRHVFEGNPKSYFRNLRAHPGE